MIPAMAPPEAKSGVRKGTGRSGRASKKQGEGKKSATKDGVPFKTPVLSNFLAYGDQKSYLHGRNPPICWSNFWAP